MTSNMLQDTHPTSPPSVGPRFRPYASPNHHVTKGRYITSNDPRGYIPVYEYPLNGQWIMMDIDDGYILWTGIWKALGNSKADIVKMIDSQPDLAPLIRRVRGGYLKIQGTWMPYEPGYGQVVASGPNRRRARRNTQAHVSANPPRDQHSTWTVVTPHDPSNSRQPPPPQPPYLHTAFYPPTRDVHFHHSYQHPPSSSTHTGPGSPDDPPSPTSMSRSSVRYSPYTSNTQRSPFDGRRDLSLDIPSLSLRENGTQAPHSHSRVRELDHITLPPIHAPADPDNSRSLYALPPISAMEDLRGLHVNDSAAVLRRLKADEPSTTDNSRRAEDWRRRSYSSQIGRSDDRIDSQAHAVYVSRSCPDPGYRSRSSSESESEGHHYNRNFGLSLSVPSDTSHSTCDPSPISPTTPRSTTSSRDPHVGPAHPPVTSDKDYGRYQGVPVPKVADWAGTHYPRGHDDIRVSDVRFGSGRHSDTDSETHPHRPW
ncbi:hypothetical protein H0H87_004029 [Tephrocybe sp. NHM501043]|nr:hypothetical protein H0H87_004029 [Tephrocybe sp. NHM501043]